MKRDFQFVGGGSDKFWSIEVVGMSYTVQFGRRGTAGQTQTKSFGSEDAARKAAEQLIGEKTRKGYVEVAAAADAVPAHEPGSSSRSRTDAGSSAAETAARAAGTAAARAAGMAAAGAAGTSAARAAGTAAAGAAGTAAVGAAGTSAAGAAGTAAAGAAGAPAAGAAGTAAASAATAVAGAATAAPAGSSEVGGAGARSPVQGGVSLGGERRIELEAADWLYAVRRPRVPMVRPTPAPFDRQVCLERLGRAKDGRFHPEWGAVVSGSMTRAEAFFWLKGMALSADGGKGAQVAAQLGVHPPTTTPSYDDVCSTFTLATRGAGSELMTVMANLLDADETLAWLLDSGLVHASRNFHAVQWELQTHVTEALPRHFLAYFTEEEMARVRQRIAPLVDPAKWPTDFYERPSPVFFLAALAGCGDVLLPLVEGWPDDHYRATGWDHTYYHQPQLIVLGLGDRQLVDLHMRRLDLPLNREAYMRGWLAVTEYAALDYARDSILAIGKREEAEQLLRILALVKAPEAAPHMLELKLSSKAPKLARQWLDENPGHAVAGLVETACGRGRLADAAIELLRDVKRGGNEALIREAIGEGGFERVRRDVLERVEKVYPVLEAQPAWLPHDKAPKLPAWLRMDELPPLLVGPHHGQPGASADVAGAAGHADVHHLADAAGHADVHRLADAAGHADVHHLADAAEHAGVHRLADAHVALVLGALAKAALPQRGPVLDDLRAAVTPESLDAFAWRLFEAWLVEGAPAKEKWALSAVGLLGSDALALRLTPMIRAWPGESQHQRAVHGLDCLMAIGTDTALMCLNGIAQKLPFKALKARAAECMESIARQRGMTRAELEDRIVPDCDLDARGTRVFDFGPRQFTFVLGPDMKPMVKDADGKPRPDLPAPNSKDDAVRAAEAVEAWKLLKKQVREVARVQAERLEQAMVTGRRWTPDAFTQLLVRHPLMTHLVKLLVWAGYGRDGAVQCTFRVTDEHDLADASDDPVNLDGVAAVGIVHPLHLTEAVRSAWGEVLSDYQVVPPFPQLGRPVFRLEPAEVDKTEITRFAGRKLPATSLVGTLERLAWQRGIPQDAGFFCEHSKPFPGANVTAVVVYEGVPVGYMEGWDEQEIERCFFVPGIYTPEMYPQHEDAVPLREVDAVALSEVLKDLTLVASKGA